MRWERQSVRLTCGCDGRGRWDDLWVGAPQKCSRHGDQEVEHMSRVYLASGSSDYSLGVVADEGG